MIVKRDVAKEISGLMLEYGARLNESVRLAQEKCSDQEFQAYRKAVGLIMGNMLLEVMNPLYDAHPDLRPEGLTSSGKGVADSP